MLYKISNYLKDMKVKLKLMNKNMPGSLCLLSKKKVSVRLSF